MKLLLKNLTFTLVVHGTVGVYLPYILTRGDTPHSAAAYPVSLALFGVALGTYVWAVWNFASRGRATPLPLDAPKTLIIAGPYLYTRNPMYVALFSALLGWLLLYQGLDLLLYAVGVVAAVTQFVIRYEEPHLKHEFGAQYASYTASVPRWFPRLRRSPDA